MQQRDQAVAQGGGQNNGVASEVEEHNPDGGHMPPSQAEVLIHGDENGQPNKKGCSPGGGCASGNEKGCQGGDHAPDGSSKEQERGPRIYFASRTHSQIAQLIRCDDCGIIPSPCVSCVNEGMG